MQHAGPPLLRRPQTSLSKRNKQRRGTTRGYIYGVAPNNTQPTTCSVVIDNNPPLSGFTLPAGQGPILPAGTDTYQNRLFNGPFLMDPNTMLGGTSVVIDLDTMAVIQILHGTSGTQPDGTTAYGYVPSTAETLVGTHTHVGGFDTDGHILPQPVSMDNEVADGTNFARVATTEMTGNTVKQLNDGPNVRTAAQVAGVLDVNSNLLGNPFGSTSGVVYANADDSLSGLSATGTGTSTSAMYPASQCLLISGDILSGSVNGPLIMTVGNTTNGYSAQVSIPAGVFTLTITRYKSSTPTVIGTYTNGGVTDMTAQIIRLRMAVDFTNKLVEASADTFGAGGQCVAYSGVVSDVSNWPTFTTVPVAINAGGSTGKLQNFIIHPRELYLGDNAAYQGVINPPGSAHPLAAGVVDTQAIAAQAVTTLAGGCTVGISGPGLYTSTAAPSMSAPTGSLCASAAGHLYINQSGGGSGTTWTLIL